MREKRVLWGLLCFIVCQNALALGADPAQVTAPPDFTHESVLQENYGEGTETDLRPEAILHLQSFGEDLKLRLYDLLESIRSESFTDQKRRLIDSTRSILKSTNLSQTKSERLLRFTLLRALKLVDILRIETQDNPNPVGILDAQVLILSQSIEFAMKYYNETLEILHQTTEASTKEARAIPYAKYGIEYVQFLMDLDAVILDASAQLRLASNAIGLFHVDLARDVRVAAYRYPIMILHDYREHVRRNRLYPAHSDQAAVRTLRKLKRDYFRALGHAKRIENKLTLAQQKSKDEKKVFQEKLSEPPEADELKSVAVKQLYLNADLSTLEGKYAYLNTLLEFVNSENNTYLMPGEFDMIIKTIPSGTTWSNPQGTKIFSLLVNPKEQKFETTPFESRDILIILKALRNTMYFSRPFTSKEIESIYQKIQADYSWNSYSLALQVAILKTAMYSISNLVHIENLVDRRVKSSPKIQGLGNFALAEILYDDLFICRGKKESKVPCRQTNFEELESLADHLPVNTAWGHTDSQIVRRLFDLHVKDQEVIWKDRFSSYDRIVLFASLHAISMESLRSESVSQERINSVAAKFHKKLKKTYRWNEISPSEKAIALQYVGERFAEISKAAAQKQKDDEEN